MQESKWKDKTGGRSRYPKVLGPSKYYEALQVGVGWTFQFYLKYLYRAFKDEESTDDEVVLILEYLSGMKGKI